MSIDYEEAVRKGKSIIAELSNKQWALGDLAAEVEKAYGENRLEQFAHDISFPGASCTLGRYRDVCRAFPKNRGRPRFFASAQILATHPDRLEIVTHNPAISKAEARELMRELRGEATPVADDVETDDVLEEEADDVWATDTEPSATADAMDTEPATPAKAKGVKKQAATSEQKPEWLRNIEGWYRNQVTAVNEVTNELNKIMEKCDPEQRKQLATLDPTLLLDASQSLEKKAAEFVDFVDTPLEQAADELIQQDRVVVTPAPKRTRRASKPVQPGA
jgi:hypothetical protein